MCNATINQESLISQFELRTHHAPRTSQALPVLFNRTTDIFKLVYALLLYIECNSAPDLQPRLHQMATEAQ